MRCIVIQCIYSVNTFFLIDYIYRFLSTPLKEPFLKTLFDYLIRMSTVVLILGTASLTLVTAYRGADMLATSLAESSSSISTSSESSSSIPSSSSTSSETISSVSSSTSSIVTSNKCIVTIKGGKYDITTLRNSHSGGDIFVCNTDMSTTFSNQHGNDLARIKQYLVTTSGTKTTVKPVTKGTEVFTESSLATHNKPGNCYIAYKGVVYSVSTHPSWSNCTHNGITGGRDVTNVFPHPLTYMTARPVMGTYSGPTINGTPPNVEDENEIDDD